MTQVLVSESVSHPDRSSGGSSAPSPGRIRMGQSFEPVLEAAKLGSEWAWATIYREIAGPVIGFLRARGVADPEEAAGDVFFALSRTVEQFEGNEDSFRILVFAFAYQRVVDERHSDLPPRSQLADRVLDRIKRDVVIPEEQLRRDTVGEIREAFEILTQEQRDVLSLRVVAGLSVEQTAQVVDLGIDTVKSLQRRALAKIRRTVPGEGVLAL